MSTSRREFLKTTAGAAAGLAMASRLRGQPDQPQHENLPKPEARADSVIFIWLPGGVAQTDTWDPKQFTPFEKGMKGSDVLGTCEPIPTAADGIFLGEGMEQIASVMDKGTILRTLTNKTMFGAIHLKAQYYMMTGYLFPAGLKAPSIGAVVGRTMGRRDPNVPPYIYIGRDIDTSDEERLFISEFIGPGFYGIQHAPFMIPDAGAGLATLSAAAGMSMERLDRRQSLRRALVGAMPGELAGSQKAMDFSKTIEDARAMMDSPVKRAFNYREEETPETVAAYEPRIGRNELLDPNYYNGQRFGHGLLLARRLVEKGARFVQVEYQYGPFLGFDMHENGQRRMQEMKKQIDGGIAQLIRDLDQRGMLERTLVVIASEFGRTIAAQPSAGVEPDGAAEKQTGNMLTLDSEKMYGFHGHFSSCNCMAFFGGGFKKGFVYGKTAERHPMAPVENPVYLTDVHATIYDALGIPPDQSYVTEGRPFYVTQDGKGRAVGELMV